MKTFACAPVFAVAFAFLALFSFASNIQTVSAATIMEDEITVVKAQVTHVEDKGEREIGGTDTKTRVQKLDAMILEGAEKGTSVSFENDYPVQLKEGDTFYLRKVHYADGGKAAYTVSDPYRLNQILFFTLLFVVLVFIFGGKQGIRGLASLIGSLLLITFVLLPGILNGYSPLLISIGVASLIIVLGSYVTHGFNKTTSSAVVGMIATVVLVGILAHIAVSTTQLTGFDSEESVYLNFSTSGTIDFVGLLLGGMLIGLLGVLYDAAIGQAIAVEELHRVAPHLSRLTIYRRAIRMGKEHIGALVNTLAIAYVGVSLPLLLLLSSHDIPILQLINRENFAAEIIRTLIGSIGLVLAVPITTVLAIFILIRNNNGTGASSGLGASASADVIKRELEEIEHLSHTHSH